MNKTRTDSWLLMAVFGTIVLVMLRVAGVLILPWWLIFMPYMIVAGVWAICIVGVLIISTIDIYETNKQKRKLSQLANTLSAFVKAFDNKEDDDESES